MQEIWHLRRAGREWISWPDGSLADTGANE
jgi:hypothetical protein